MNQKKKKHVINKETYRNVQTGTASYRENAALEILGELHDKL